MAEPDIKSRTEFRVAPRKRARRSRSVQTAIHTVMVCSILAAAFAVYWIFAQQVSAPSTRVATSERPLTEKHIGHITMPGGSDCKKRQFDNYSGTFKETVSVDCVIGTPANANPSSVYSVPNNRLEAVRRSMTNR